MKKRIILFMPIVVIVISAVIMLICRRTYGTSLQHYSQYIIPAQGQIICELGQEKSVELYVYEEIELSELADKTNIKQINFITEENQVVPADSWDVCSLNEVEGYVYKRLSAM